MDAPDEVVFEGLRLAVSRSVYEPSDDSFMMARAAARFARGRVLDVGTGTGIIGLSAAKNPSVTSVTMVDVNPDALALARRNAAANGLEGRCRFVRSDLFEQLAGEVFDTITFNPPYLPEGEGDTTRALNEAWNGGPDGRKYLDPFLDGLPAHVAPGGQVLLLSSSLNGTEKTVARLASLGFSVESVEASRFFFEKLEVLRAVRGSLNNART